MANYTDTFTDIPDKFPLLGTNPERSAYPMIQKGVLKRCVKNGRIAHHRPFLGGLEVR